ncbi:hypothetical protein [Pseudoxanthomonas sangjuensis]|uniref:hypothetical protein n=1 Tax=Pseudoxanthomonas sangjuensis TaxID=1503750 RepID=UPI00139180F6|nr:hypothetical protein [Pseudoxanthomonas sangjuensis]
MSAAIFTIFFYLAWAAVCSIPAFLLALFLPASHPWLRYIATVIVFTLFVAPSLGSATIALVSIPFAFILLATVISFDLSGLVWALQEWPLWHAVAFPATLLVALAIFHRLRPNNSFKPTPLRGAA